MTSTDELRDSDFEQLDKFLASVKGGAIPNTEALDGFFAALACCPDFVAPSEYMDALLGEETEGDDFVFGTAEEIIQVGKLVARHFNHVSEQLYSEVGYCPVLLEDEEGLVQANDWAKGFLVGIDLRRSIWTELFEDEEHAGSMVPIWALAYEKDPDPKMQPFKEPVTPEQRDELIIASAAGVMRMFRYFSAQQDQYVEPSGTYVRLGPKVGRNDPCPCGSGKKFKKCCATKQVLH
ncbi:UPF0149 family protein [Pseudovibrio sp. WM33]|uniref:UPF0149 family protein n=1 Tax=Pseudovibrio sp. WM33 TaxID=1735585 RepID=UPI0007AED4B8|nr:UPF0149 family protein [Pseudovibrio sp. WM33]KZL28951.1 hypothetical protein PsWM33_00258 [Pseudovibrio sp. WM33]